MMTSSVSMPKSFVSRSKRRSALFSTPRRNAHTA